MFYKIFMTMLLSELTLKAQTAVLTGALPFGSELEELSPLPGACQGAGIVYPQGARGLSG